jgi:hypothetical protein
MTSKIKVDNIENQCGGAVVTKCGGTTTISGTVVKSNTLQASDAGNIISQSGTTITLGASGDTINLASGASQSGFGRTGTVDWDTTPKTGTFSAVSGNGYFCNTSGGAFTVNLPAGVAGAIVSFADYAATWNSNNVTVTPNGTDKIGSINQNATLNVVGQSVTFVFVDSTQGWINTMDSTSNVRANPPFIVATVSGACNTLVTAPCCANVKIATFTGPGTFCVSGVSGCATNNAIAYMVVAGGASGGSGNGGGGGAGGFRESNSPVTPYSASPLNGPGCTTISVTAQAYAIAVGAGGAATTGNNGTDDKGNNGNISTFSTITSAGGGGGGGSTCSGPVPGPAVDGQTGGSGGGGSFDMIGGGGTALGGVGNTPPVSPSQGMPGGTGRHLGPSYSSTGGGGGATVQGTNQAPGTGGSPGGGGATTSISATPTAYAGGGGGAGSPGAGGTGGGAPGVQPTTAGTANTGGGGGGGGNGPSFPSGAGGSGIVIIRYKFQ